ncbi:hypothetical protein, partial [Escherichia coli]|uniref:hypothetical protein n=1 Tax=Escherichia coli TaxID=562 RepID=UPI001BDB8647
GSLFGEWGDMGHYMDADFYSEIYWSSNTAGGGRQYIVSLENGAHGSVQTSEYFHVACYKKSYFFAIFSYRVLHSGRSAFTFVCDQTLH